MCRVTATEALQDYRTIFSQIFVLINGSLICHTNDHEFSASLVRVNGATTGKWRIRWVGAGALASFLSRLRPGRDVG